MGMDTGELLQFLEQEASAHEGRAHELRNCIRLLESYSPPAQQKSTAKATPKKAKGKAAKGSKITKAASSDDAPRSVKGRMPTKGVVQAYCSTLKDRRNELDRLQGLGYTRVGINQPLTAGTYDVRPTGEPDDSSYILYREIESEGASA